MSDREACIANPHTLTPSAPLTCLHLHLLLAPCTWACRKPSKQQGDNKSLLGGGFNLHASLAALSVMPLIPFYLLNISCKFFLPSKHKLLTFLSNYSFIALYCQHLYVLQNSLATSTCKHLFFYMATNKISFHIQHTNSSLEILSSIHSHNPLRYHQLPAPSN